MKIKALLYCTKEKKQKDLLWSNDLKHFFLDGAYNRIIDDLPKYLLNGKIVAECDFNVEEIACSKIDYALSYSIDGTGQAFYENSKEYEPFYLGLNISNIELLKRSCFTNIELNNYLQGKNGYAIHIKNLNIFDKPRELSDCYKIIAIDDADFNENDYKCISITKAPQNMMRVWLYENGEWVMYILISIQPQWMCKILNGEKTIEVGKVVLKEMLK